MKPNSSFRENENYSLRMYADFFLSVILFGENMNNCKGFFELHCWKKESQLSDASQDTSLFIINIYLDEIQSETYDAISIVVSTIHYLTKSNLRFFPPLYEL